MSYYLGLDSGGTAIKSAIYDDAGNEIGTASEPTRILVPHPGFAEQDMNLLWRTVCRVIRQVLKKTGLRGTEIRAAAACGHGKGLYLCDERGAPLRKGILSADNRAAAYPVRWRRQGVEDAIYPLTRQRLLPSQPPSLLAWLRDREPESLRGIRHIFACKDYIRFRLTGEAFSELTDASGWNLVDLQKRAYAPELFDRFGLPDLSYALPPLRNPDEICGYVTRKAAEETGLAENTPVAGGLFDIDACALSAGVVNSRHICMVAGTWSINEVPLPEPASRNVAMNSLFCVPGWYLAEESSPTSAGNLEWYIQTMLPELAAEQGDAVYETISRAVQAVPPREACPVFLPFLFASSVHPRGTAALLGMTAHHTRGHIARSIYEGVCFSHRQHLEKLLTCMPRPPESIRLTGGAARSDVWSQLFADVMGLPVERIAARETGTLGAAIAAAAASGAFAGLAEAAGCMSRVVSVTMPNEAHQEAYGLKYRAYLETIQALIPLWNQSQMEEGGPAHA